MAKLTLSADAAKISGLWFVTVYVDDFQKAVEFYQDILALEKSHQPESDACFFAVGANPHGLFLQGGARAKTTKPEDSHASFVLTVESASALFQRLKLNGVKTLYAVPGIPITDFLRMSQAAGIRVLSFRHEQSAGYAASIAGFLTKQPGVCVTVSAPGSATALSSSS